MPFWGSTPLRALFREIHIALPEKGTLAKKHETARPVRNEQIRSVEREVIFRTPHDQLGQERHRPEGRNRPELSTSRRLRPAVADFAATTQPSSRSRSASGLRRRRRYLRPLSPVTEIRSVLLVGRPKVRKSVGPSSLASRLIGLCASKR